MRFFGKSVRTPNIGSKLPILALVGISGAGLAILLAIAQVEPFEAPEAGTVASGAAPAEITTAPPVSGQSLLEHAIRTLESRRCVSAKVRHSVDLFNHRLAGTGIYLERRSPTELLFRLELRTQVDGEPSSLLHVFDGRYLWMYRKLGDAEGLSRIDAARVVRALEESGDIDEIAEVGRWPGLGGLSKLLRGLHATFNFTSVEETRLAGQLPVRKLQGEWRPEKLVELLPELEDAVKEGKPLDLGNLPEHLPDDVLLFLGKVDQFPYRIEYRRRGPNRPGGEHGSEGRSVVTMELFEVDLNASIHPTRFLYTPGNLECSDETSRFLKNLGSQQ